MIMLAVSILAVIMVIIKFDFTCYTMDDDLKRLLYSDEDFVTEDKSVNIDKPNMDNPKDDRYDKAAFKESSQMDVGELTDAKTAQEATELLNQIYRGEY